MNRKLLVLHIFLCVCIGFLLKNRFVFAEPIKARNSSGEFIRKFFGDFDQNGRTDSVTITESSGPGFYSVEVLIRDGEKKHVYEQEFSSGQILNPVYISQEVYNRYRKLFLDSVFRHPVKVPDASLMWLVDGYCGKKLIKRDIFDLVIKYTPRWNTALDLPSSYTVPLSDNKSLGCLGKGDTAVLLVYTAHNHFNIRDQGESVRTAIDTVPVNEKSPFSIYKTQHGVIVQHKGKYSWVFISDEQITEGVEKLRAPSIKQVEALGDYVIVFQTGISGNRIFIVNYKAGLCLRVRPEVYNEKELIGIMADKQRLIMKTAEGGLPMTLSQIRKAEKEASRL